MLHEMSGQRLSATSDCEDVQVLAGDDSSKLCTLLINYNTQQMADRVAVMEFTNLSPFPPTRG